MVAEESAILEDIEVPKPRTKKHAVAVGDATQEKTDGSAKKKPGTKAAKKKTGTKGTKKEPEGTTPTRKKGAQEQKDVYQPKLTIIRPGDPRYGDVSGGDQTALLDAEFAENVAEEEPATQLTQDQVSDLLEEAAQRGAEEERQLEVLTQLGKALDAGGAWLLAQPKGRTPRRMSVREFLMAELLKFRDKSGRLRDFYLNEAQKDYQRYGGKRSMVLKALQLGITTYVAARFFVNCITRPGTLAVQVAHDQQSAEQIFRIVHRMLENLPEPLRKGALKTSRANVRQIVFPALDSEYRVETAADPNAGRGLTIQNLHCSEVARWPRDIAETLASLRAAVPLAGEIVLESTPNGASGAFYHEWQHAGESGYTRHFYPWWYDKNYRRRTAIGELTEEELELKERHNLDDEQIAFRREVQTNFGRRAKEEYAEDAKSCFLASGECMFDVETIQKAMDESEHIEDKVDNGKTIIYLKPVSDRFGAGKKDYVIGVDPAGGGLDGDYACAQVIDRVSGMQCAELLGHYTPVELAGEVARLARYYNDALVAVERNNHGYLVINELHAFHRYYHLYPTDPKKEAGWLTTRASRPRLMSAMAANFRSHPQIVHSHRLLEQMRTFVLHADTSYSAASGCHDDAVMAMALALVARDEEAGQPFQPQKMMAGDNQPSCLQRT